MMVIILMMVLHTLMLRLCSYSLRLYLTAAILAFLFKLLLVLSVVFGHHRSES